ncbi:MAG: hypothetical protein GY880_09675 [Planctomycetaceae bacterium]|nr:hypothetical protein [Planctomycetaceae bacterium]
MENHSSRPGDFGRYATHVEFNRTAMQTLSVPTESDWRSEAWCLDAEYAYRIFNGKTHSDATKLFQEHAIGRQEDVMFMPNACFPYYFNVYMDYLLSSDAKEDSDGASCFFSLVDFKRPEIKSLDEWLIKKTIKTVAHIGKNQVFYDADVDIYGSFHDRATETINRLA